MSTRHFLAPDKDKLRPLLMKIVVPEIRMYQDLGGL